MKQKATAPAIILGVVVAIVIVYFIGKTFMAPSPTNNGPHVFPSFIDPATGKPKEGHTGGSGMAPNGVPAAPASSGNATGGGASGGQ